MENGNYWSETQGTATSRGGVRDSDLGDPPAIGRYRVIRLLGQGGFGRVYLARDDELDRAVAIKVPNPERIAGPEDVEAYLAEARILAKLDHPNIVPVYDVGRTDDGLCYVVSKYIEGSDLAERLRQGRPSFRESAELVAVVAEALHHAHTRGLVHRDIKPANILIDASGEPCVADFGLALKDEDYGKGARLAGTPAYMSPEQARGEGHRVDGRSDIFSLGVVFYELLDRPEAVPGRHARRGHGPDRHRRAAPAPPDRRHDPPRAGADLPEGAGEAGVGAVQHRPATWPTTCGTSSRPTRRPARPRPPPGTVSPPPGSTQEATPTPPTPARSDSDGPRRQDRPQGAAVVRPARRRLLPRAAARPPRPRRPAREPPVLEDPDRVDRPRHRRSGSA